MSINSCGCAAQGGHIYKFEEDGVRAVKKYETVHQGPVSELLYSPNGNHIVTGGKDGKIKFHNSFMAVQFEINLCKVSPTGQPQHRYACALVAASGCMRLWLCRAPTSLGELDAPKPLSWDGRCVSRWWMRTQTP